jgi:outer membrane biosynthesis protein TonB
MSQLPTPSKSTIAAGPIQYVVKVEGRHPEARKQKTTLLHHCVDIYTGATMRPRQSGNGGDQEQKMMKFNRHFSAAAAVAFLILALVQAPSTCAFVATSPSMRTTRTFGALHAIKGAAKDAEEDLKLTIEIIMNHMAGTGGGTEVEDKETKSETVAAKEELSETKKTNKAVAVEPVKEEVQDKQDKKSSKSEKKSRQAKPDKKSKKTKEQKPPSPRKEEVAPVAAEKKKDPSSSSAAAAASTAKKASAAAVEIDREFRFVDDSEKGFKTEGRTTISCDGRLTNIPGGVTLELSHWTGNETPDDLYADTSTEMALKLAKNQEYAEKTKDALVLNNHYDTDGVLSVWACLQPKEALKYSDLLIQGAEAGDFGEWSSDEGVKLDCAVTEYINRVSYGEGTAFVTVLMEYFPGLVEDIHSTGGKKYADLWRPGFATALASWGELKNERAKLKSFNDDIVIVERPWSVPPISPYALHRALKEKGLDRSTKRILHALTDGKGARFTYEKIGHGWVQKLVDRPSVPGVNADKLVEDLNEEFEGSNWKKDSSGLISICQSTSSVATPVEEVAEYLAKHDDGLSQ